MSRTSERAVSHCIALAVRALDFKLVSDSMFVPSCFIGIRGLRGCRLDAYWRRSGPLQTQMT